MAHMDAPAGAKNAIHHLHGRKLLGETLELKYVISSLSLHVTHTSPSPVILDTHTLLITVRGVH